MSHRNVVSLRHTTNYQICASFVLTLLRPQVTVCGWQVAKDPVTYNNNNTNNSYIALYPVKIYKLAALYIINIKIRLTIKNTINAYININ